MKLLLIEDDQRDVDHIRRIIPRGMDLAHVETVSAAQDAIADNGFAVILCDLHLHNYQGLEVLAALVPLARPAHLPIVVISNHPADAMAEAAIIAGADDYHHKEGEPAELHRAILRAAARKRRDEAAPDPSVVAVMNFAAVTTDTQAQTLERIDAVDQQLSVLIMRADRPGPFDWLFRLKDPATRTKELALLVKDFLKLAAVVSATVASILSALSMSNP